MDQANKNQTLKVNLNYNQNSSSRYKRKLQATKAFLELIKKNPMSDAVIQEVKKRKIRVNNRWLIDFASCNYLGFDVHPEVMASVSDHVKELTTYPGQSRLLGSPYLYEKIEEEVIKVSGLEDCIIFPSLSLTHPFAIPILAEEGDLFLDKRAHKTIYDGCMRATQYGATMISFQHNDCDDLEEKLKQSTAKKKLICVDGVYGMDGYTTPLNEMLKLCEIYDAYLYMDDAHGFGILGERAPDELCPYGKGGGGIVKYYGKSYDRIIFSAVLSKAYSGLVGFMGCTKAMKDFLKISIDPYLYSGPAPIPVLSCLLKSFEINAREGDQIRAHLYNLCYKLEAALTELKFRNVNHTRFPVYRLTMEDIDQVHFAGQFLYDQGIYVTLAPYPLVPRHEAGFRIQLTAANTMEEVDHLIATLKKLEKHAPIQKESESGLIVKIKEVEIKSKINATKTRERQTTF